MYQIMLHFVMLKLFLLQEALSTVSNARDAGNPPSATLRSAADHLRGATCPGGTAPPQSPGGDEGQGSASPSLPQTNVILSVAAPVFC